MTARKKVDVNTLKIWPLPRPQDEPKQKDGPIVHMLIDPDDGPLCEPTEPALSTNDLSKVTCERCRFLWIKGADAQ